VRSGREMDRRLIINADDFGLCEGVNKAVVQAHTQGVLISATVMVNMPGARDAIEIARGLARLGVGIHLNLTQGRPVSTDDSVRCLLNADGCFAHRPAKLALLSVVRRDVRNAIRAEFAAQIQWAIERGLRPTHIDSHKHIHCWPGIFPIVCDLAKRFEIRAIRFAYEPKRVCRAPWPACGEGGGRRAGIVRAMARINRLQNPSFFKTDMLLGIAHTGRIDESFFQAVACQSSFATAEVMTHPGFAEGLAGEKTRLVGERKAELDALCSEKTKQYFKDAGIRLVHYGQL